MKRLLLVMQLLVLAASASGCSSDIVVKSDVGEISTVKESAVTTFVFDPTDVKDDREGALPITQEGIKTCQETARMMRKYGVQDDCNYWVKMIDRLETDLKVIASMPEIKVIKYRSIDTNVNGDKTASGYKYVGCIPEGNSEDQKKWEGIVSVGISRLFDKDISSNLDNDGTVLTSLSKKLCKKYGNI